MKSTAPLFFALVLSVASLPAYAGAIKELVIEHEDAIVREVANMVGYSYDHMENTKFVKSNIPGGVALESLVTVVSKEGFATEIVCTSYFAKNQFGSFDESDTSCEMPE